jgi:cytochrome P450
MPGIGVGLFARVYFLTDANEYMKVLRQEGPFPFGVIQVDWPLVSYFHSVKSALMDEENGFFGQGLKWKRQRKFLQTDLLSPAAAKGYVPGMVHAAQIASKGLVDFRSEVNKFMLWSSFDMFSSIMFGEVTGVANPKSNPDPENIKFCNASVEAIESIFPLLLKPHLRLFLKFGVKPAEYRHFEEQLNISRSIANAKLEAFRKRKELQDITEAERASYFSRAIDRLKADPDSISEDELAEIGGMLLTASVDTTSSVLNWCIIHLAMNPTVQESLYQEISKNVSRSMEGCLTEMVLSKAAAPFLHAVIRESHRMTPSLTISLMKSNTQADLEIHGVTIPKGSMIALDAYSIGMDPEYVPDCNAFRPERWLEEEVKMRAGTPAEMIDHPLYRDPFSAGSRKCPGSRVANYEALVMISQLLLDWKISFEDESIKSLDDIQQFQGLTVQPKVPILKVLPRSND